MIFGSSTNLFENQELFNFDQFAVTTLEGLMLLEREEYLKAHTEKKGSVRSSVFLDGKWKRIRS